MLSIDEDEDRLYLKVWDEDQVNWDVADELIDVGELFRNLENLKLPSIMDDSWPAVQEEVEMDTSQDNEIWTSIDSSSIDLTLRDSIFLSCNTDVFVLFFISS